MSPKIGDTVLAYWKGNDAYYLGTVVDYRGDDYFIVFEDGEQAKLNSNGIRKANIEVGTKVFARWSDGRFYPGTVAEVVGRAFFINFDDGDKGWVSASGIAVK
jgi:hypothetical protein